jgi:photosystem II stability/assembly factor-like uncharacterized protein
MKLIIKLNFLLLLFYLPLHSQDNPAVTYIQHISIDHSEPNIVYVASITHGLFKSTDYGQSWVPKYDTTDNKTFYVVIPDPKNPERVFAGGQTTGVLLSTDKGETWKSIGPTGVTINDIAIDKTNPKRLFVLANEGVYSNQNIEKEEWVLCFDRNKYLSESLHLTSSGRRVEYTRFQKVAVSPFHPNTIIVGARFEGGFYRSDDGGQTWRHESISGIYRRADVIHFHPSDSNIIYIATHHQGMFKTFNFGKSWVPHSDGLEPQIRLPHYGVYLISGLAVDKNDPDVFYSGSDYSNWKSTDGGENWFELHKSLTYQFVRAMAVDPVNSNIVYAGSNVGMYKSTNAGESWYAINIGFPEIQIKKKIEVQSDEGEIQFALSESYPFIFRKTETEQWTSAGWLLSDYRIKAGHDLYFYDTNKELVFVSDTGHFISKDYGFRWSDKKSLFDFVDAKSIVKELKLYNPNFNTNYVATIDLTGDVFFDHSLVDSIYRRPPYISLQIVEVGYPYNGTVPAWSINIDDCLKSTVEIPKSLIDVNKKYYLYAEVRDFQQNYKTAFSEIEFKENVIMPISMELKEGFCLKLGSRL